MAGLKLHNRTPDIENIYKVLRREKPQRATLFEFYLNGTLYEILSGRPFPYNGSALDQMIALVDSFAAAGYDYTNVTAGGFYFPAGNHGQEGMKTISLNQGFVITDEKSYEAYRWPDADRCDFSPLADITPHLPGNMKLMVSGPGGVLENVISLMGYENLCFMLYEEPQLVMEIFRQVGSRLLRYYELVLEYDTVGFIMSNDDWGFNTQTFFSPEVMRKYVFPWHRKIVDAAHKKNRPAALHSCGYFNEVMEDTIEMGFDAKHSYEDNIIPVEDSYDRWHNRIAILGGMDIDFMVRSPIEAIETRCCAMLDRAAGSGAYALGTGNSVPEYLPPEKYFAMTKTALEY